MAGRGRKRQRGGGAPKHGRKATRTDFERKEIEQLTERIASGAPPPGSVDEQPNVDDGSYAGAKRFDELPLSQYTQQALAEHSFTELTAIQRAALPHALCGRDVLGAAKTGSGKTLCFLIPAVERLFRAQWTQLDGLGALVLAPTRELALQIFSDLRKVGARHSLSAGLLIGGKDVATEQSHIARMNILIATPGRLLQHMDETPGFDCSTVQLLVLDEADRCMDMGFQASMDAILHNLPAQRQTLLFSATQSKKVSDLARLSLQDPEYIAVHAEAAAATPQRLKQYYVPCPLPQKLDLLWFFIKTHLKQRTIVFLATCKQVKFVYEAFRKLRPGVPLAMLHGKMKQMKRMAVFYSFQQSAAMVLFATDIAARGLDFPAVDWVLQVDCAEDADAYIHRVGRTARFKAAGEALAFLAPSEQESMLAALAAKKVPLSKRAFARDRVKSIAPALTSLMAKSDELKATAQAAFVSYVRSIFLHPNKEVFDVAALDLEAFADSFGLPTMPHVRMVNKLQRQAGKQAAKARNTSALAPAAATALQHAPVAGQGSGTSATATAAGSDGDDASGAGSEPASLLSDGPGSSQDDTGAATPHVHFDGGADAGRAEEDASSDVDSDVLLHIKRARDGGPEGATDGRSADVDRMLHQASMRPGKKRKRLRIHKDAVPGKKVLFDAEGHALDPLSMLASSRPDDVSGAAQSGGGADGTASRFAAIHARLRAADAEDAERARVRRREAKALRKAKAQAQALGAAQNTGVQLGAADAPDSDAGSDSGASVSEASGGNDGDDLQRGAAAHSAYFGMTAQGQGHMMGSAPKNERLAPRAGAAAEAAIHRKAEMPSSLAEQEALVKRLMAQS